MISKAKPIAVFILLLAILSYAMYRSEQTVASISLILLVATSYKHFVKPFIARAEAFVRRLDYAKFKDLELRADQQAAELVRLEGLQLTLIQDIVLRNLEPDLYALIVNLSLESKMQMDKSHLDRLRQLRDRGLIEHDRQRLRDSETVWLTSLGRQVAEILAQPNKRSNFDKQSLEPN